MDTTGSREPFVGTRRGNRINLDPNSPNLMMRCPNG